MKSLIRGLFLFLIACVTSCSGSDDDTGKVCTGNCNVFKGRIYTEDNVGIADVTITLSYSINQIGVSYNRIIARSKTDQNGNYTIEAFIKDNEFNSGFFHLSVDQSKIENAVGNAFYKPSELIDDVAPKINECAFSDVDNRSQITVIDYKIPYKTSFEVHLNNFNQTTPHDDFSVGNSIEYGFQRGYNRFLTKQSTGKGYGSANGVNTTFNIPGVFGENYLVVYKFKGGSVDNLLETIIINNPNTNSPLNYSF